MLNVCSAWLNGWLPAWLVESSLPIYARPYYALRTTHPRLLFLSTRVERSDIRQKGHATPPDHPHPTHSRRTPVHQSNPIHPPPLPPPHTKQTGEIGKRPTSDRIQDREAYTLAAGLALGLVTLGKGGDGGTHVI